MAKLTLQTVMCSATWANSFSDMNFNDSFSPVSSDTTFLLIFNFKQLQSKDKFKNTVSKEIQQNHNLNSWFEIKILFQTPGSDFIK